MSLSTRRESIATTMEGALSVPPDRGTIIGRAVWKVRHVVVGSAIREQMQPATAAASTNRLQLNRTSTGKELTRVVSEGIFLSIYKSKEDTEPILQHSISSIADCQVQMLAHRKQGPVLPTLVINVLPDPSLDKARKRRSSRTATFAAPKEPGPTTLLFRPGEDHHPTLQDWARFIQQLIQPHIPDRAPLSPVTPASPTFINPFAPRSREASDMQPRPDSGNAAPRPGFFLKNPSQTHPLRDRPVTFSDSPSLRSKRSDLSSQTSSMTQSHVAYPNYNMIGPADLPSPATTIGEYQGEFIEGWTSAQGRSSALNSPIRGRGSISSQAPAHLPPIPDLDSPGPRETILDRAFQMRCIPGSEREVPGEEKLSSLARFDALMREVDEKRRQREAEEAKLMPPTATPPSSTEPKSAFDMDDSNSDDIDSDRDSDDDSDGVVAEADTGDQFPPTTAQRALEFISGRFEPTQRHQLSSRGYSGGVGAPPSYNHEAFMALSSSGSSQSRPQTGYSKNRSRPGMTQRTHSQPHLATILASSSTPLEALDSEEGTGFSFTPGSPSVLHRSSTDKRQSTSSSAKRLSFGEFTRRLSSTSSLLLMQTNNASGVASSRASHSDMDLQQPPQSPPPHLHHLHPRAGLPTPLQQQQQQQQVHPQQRPQSPPPVGERCGWRGSVGVFGGGDGGFV